MIPCMWNSGTGKKKSIVTESKISGYLKVEVSGEEGLQRATRNLW